MSTNSLPSINNLHSSRVRQDNQSSELYSKVLDACGTQIAKANLTSTHTVFKIPRVMTFSLKYSHSECAVYVAKVLTSHGYKVDYVSGYLVIDWSENMSSAVFAKTNVVSVLKGLTLADPSKFKKNVAGLLAKYPGVSDIEFVVE